MEKFKKLSVIFGVGILLLFSIFYFLPTAYRLLPTALAQFTGPTGAAGTGSGAIGVNSAGSLSVGTSSPKADTKFLIVASSTGSAGFALKVIQPGEGALLLVRNDGRVAIATSSFGSTLTVDGTIYGTNLTGTVTAENVSAGRFGFNVSGGNYSFPSSLGIATTTNVGLPQSLSVYGGGYFSGNVGIGTSTPSQKLEIWGSILNVATTSGALVFSSNVSGDTNLPRFSVDVNGKLKWGSIVSGNIVQQNSQLYSPAYGQLTILNPLGDSTSTFSVWGNSGGRIFTVDAAPPDNAVGQQGVRVAVAGISTSTFSAGGRLEVYGGSFTYGGFGDLNGDGVRTVLDSNILAAYLNATGTSSDIKPLSPRQWAEADINGDGRVNRLDEAHLLNVSVSLETTEQARERGKIEADRLITYDRDNVSIGTTTIYTLFTVATATPIFSIRNSGNVGIGTTNPTNPLSVQGNANISGALTVGSCTGCGGGGLSGGQVNYIPIWTSATAQGTSTIYQASGLVGIGTTSLGSNKLTIVSTGLSQSVWIENNPTCQGTSCHTGLTLNNTFGAGNIANQIEFRGSSAFKWTLGNDLDGTGAQDFSLKDNVAGQTRWYVNSSGNVGIGVTPSYKIDVVSGGATTARFGTASTDVVIIGGGAGKVTAGTFDPLYTINGKKYATYLPGMTGVKEETTGIISNWKLVNGNLQAEIDFANAAEGSDIWLFAKTTNLQKNLGAMAVLLTPSFDGKAWYEKDAKNNRLTIFAKPITNYQLPITNYEISYRFTAPRFDYLSWPNTSTDNANGFIIND